MDTLLSVSTLREWELVVVDNGSDDGTDAYLASIDQKGFDRAHVRATFEPKRGLAAARNKGWRSASADLVAFTDDDCYVAGDYLDSVVRVFENDPAVGFLGGRILLYDETDYRVTILESQEECYFQPRTFIEAGAVQGANMAFRRSVLERIGGFDERLGAGTPFPSEDIDAAAAALWSGAIGIYDPRILVYHHHGRKTEREAQKLMRSYDAGRGAYYVKRIFEKASRPVYVKAWARSIKNECVYCLRRRRFPSMSLREISSGLYFALQSAFVRR